jgi:hypothetical protein
VEGFFYADFLSRGKWVKSGEGWLKKGKSGVKWGIKQQIEPAFRPSFIQWKKVASGVSWYPRASLG